MTRIRTKLLSALFACAAVGTFGVAAVTPANAAGDDLCAIAHPGDPTCEYGSNDVATKMDSGPQISEPCVSTESGAKVCFVKYGDYIWVYDGREDGKSAVAVWKVPGENRRGFCRNLHGVGTWARCNKNFQEGRDFEFHAIKYNAQNNAFSDPSEWQTTSTGPVN